MNGPQPETEGAPLYIVGARGWQNVPCGAECWGINNCLPEAQGLASGDFNITGWFQMHKHRLWRGGRNTREHTEWLKWDHGFPIYMQRQRADVPSSREYPLEAAEGLWPRNLGTSPIFSDSFCYMIALAILQGRGRLELRGVYLDDRIEAMTEVAGVAYWMAIAALRGLVIGSDGRLLIPFQYGYEIRSPHPSLPDDVAACIVANEHPGARGLMNRYRRQRQEMQYAEAEALRDRLMPAARRDRLEPLPPPTQEVIDAVDILQRYMGGECALPPTEEGKVEQPATTD